MDLDYDFDRADRNQRRKKAIVSILIWILLLGIAIGMAWILTNYALEFTNMVDESMEITLNCEDTVLINKLSYLVKEPERFDVIVFRKDGKEHSYYSIKRIIGLPGESVRISDGTVFINGEKLSEPMLIDSMDLYGLASNELILDEDEYFVLGDNRNSSEDSRFANVGNVVRDEIVGKAWIRTNKFAIIGKLNISAGAEKSED